MLAAAAALAAGCVSNKNDLDESFGRAYRANMEAQIIDPSAAEGAPEGSGAAADLATVRYKTDTVKRPDAGGAFTPEGGGGPQ
jgi:hypothetical protein